jgi:hypothetical protein
VPALRAATINQRQTLGVEALGIWTPLPEIDFMGLKVNGWFNLCKNRRILEYFAAEFVYRSWMSLSICFNYLSIGFSYIAIDSV